MSNPAADIADALAALDGPLPGTVVTDSALADRLWLVRELLWLRTRDKRAADRGLRFLDWNPTAPRAAVMRRVRRTDGPACSFCGGVGGWRYPVDYGTGWESDGCGFCDASGVAPLGHRAHRHEPVVVLGPKRASSPGTWPSCWRGAVIDGHPSYLAYQGDSWWGVYGRGGARPWQVLLGSAAEDGSTTDRAYGGGSRRQRRYRLACLRAVSRALREERGDG